jgi:hypothetical protein
VEDRDRRTNSHFALIVTVVVLVIVYGSLYPFCFRGNSDSNGALHALTGTWCAPAGRGDFVAAVFSLWIVFGGSCAPFAASRAHRGCNLFRLGSLHVHGTGSVLRRGLRFGPHGCLCERYRHSSGLRGRRISIPPRISMAIHNGPPSFLVLLLSCWLAYRLFPFVPVNRPPQMLDGSQAAGPLARATAVWPLPPHGGLAGRASPHRSFCRNRAKSAAASFTGSHRAFARILIVDASLSPTEVAGSALAALVWLLFSSRLRHVRP